MTEKWSPADQPVDDQVETLPHRPARALPYFEETLVSPRVGQSSARARFRFLGSSQLPRKLGEYLLVEELASGGMATVYLAVADRGRGFRRPFALKVIHAHLAKDSKMLRMFEDEARLCARLHHPNIAQVFDFGTDNGQHYIVMELLSGVTFGHFVHVARQALRTDQYCQLVAHLMSEVALGLHALHELTDEYGQSLGVVHRDISPRNVIVTFDGTVKIIDLGIARSREQTRRTVTGTLRGSLAYVSPEQVRQGQIDRRSDLWSLGVLGREALTGENPFARSSAAETIFAVVNAQLEPTAALLPAAPPALCELVDRALLREPEARPPTLEAFRTALRQVCPPPTESDKHLRRVLGELSAERTLQEARVASALSARAPGFGRRKAAVMIGAVALGGGSLWGLLWGRSLLSERVQVPPSDVSERPFHEANEMRVEAVLETNRDAGEEDRSTQDAQVAAQADAGDKRLRRAKRFGWVSVVVPGSWAKVYLGKRKLGDTPLRVRVHAGTHRLRILREGRRPGIEKKVLVQPQKTARIVLN